MEDELLNTHFFHEVVNLRRCYFIMKVQSPLDSILTTDYLVVAFSTYARNLMEFFYKTNKKKKNIAKSLNYVKTLNEEEVKKIFPEIEEWYKVLCQNLSHLYYRAENNIGISPVQIVFPTYLKLRKLLIKFLSGLPKKHKTKKMIILLKSLKEE